MLIFLSGRVDVAGDPKEDNWFEEFKKINANTPPSTPDSLPSQDSSPSSSPSRDSERRRHHRFEIDEASAQLYKEGLLALVGMGRTNLARAAVDVSEGGAQFLVHERLSPGTRVKVRIQVGKFKDSIETGGVVRWCFQSAKKKEDFFVGIEFHGRDPVQDRKVAAMRDWFTSPQYKAVKQSRQRAKSPDIQFPK
jgi:hypothetical protein